MPSYSRKYNAVPAVSRTKDERTLVGASKQINKKKKENQRKWSRNPVYKPAKPLPLYISFTACIVPGGFTKEMPLVAAMVYSNCRRT
jgi:hypothetical protein